MQQVDTNRVRADLLDIELDLVTTFLRIARASPVAETRRRNYTHAREAYQMAGRYRSLIKVSARVDRAIELKFRDAEVELAAARSLHDH